MHFEGLPLLLLKVADVATVFIAKAYHSGEAATLVTITSVVTVRIIVVAIREGYHSMRILQKTAKV